MFWKSGRMIGAGWSVGDAGRADPGSVVGGIDFDAEA